MSKISNRTLKAADRIGGAFLIMPWPKGLPFGPPLAINQSRPTSNPEHAAAVAAVKDEAQEKGLCPVSSQVRMLVRPTGLLRAGHVEQHLLVRLIGFRWVHATGPKSLVVGEQWLNE